MTRVLYLHNKVEISGGERSLINLWRNSDLKKLRPYLAIPGDGRFKNEAQRLGVRILYLKVPNLRLKNFGKILQAVLWLRKCILINKIDIIHSYTPRNNIIGALVGKLHKIPVIWHERNMIYGMEKDITKKLLFLPHSIICNSKAIAERFRTRKGIPDKVRVIINGVDTSKFRPRKDSPELTQKYNVNGKNVVGLISNFGKRKNPECFLDVCPLILKQVPNTRFIVVGDEFTDEDRGRRDELLQKVKKLHLEDDVIFTGFVPDVSEIIRIFDIGVAVTEKEACSNAILEILASGKPVVAFDTGGNAELIEHNLTGKLVNFDDIVGLADSIVELLINVEERNNMGLRAAKRTRQFFDVRLNVLRTTELYNEILKENVKKDTKKTH